MYVHLVMVFQNATQNFWMCACHSIPQVAIVGAPVTTWSAYDTGYTERYMSTPAENPLGYKMSSVLNYANRFPDE